MKILILLIVLFLSLEIAEAQWTNAGLSTTYIRCLGSDGTNLFAGANGIALTMNNGNNWSSADSGISGQYIYSLSYDGTNFYAGHNLGLHYSNNNGNYWTSLGLTTHYVNAIAASGTTIFAGTSDSGVFFTNDFGSSWNMINNGLTNHQVLTLNIKDTMVYAGTGSGLFMSNNNGSSWTHCTSGIPGSCDVRSFLVYGHDIYFGTFGNGIYRSTNNGLTWTAKNNLIGNNSAVFGLASAGSEIFAGTLLYGVYASTDSGNTWTNLVGLSGIQLNTLIVSNNILFAGTQSGVKKHGTIANLNAFIKEKSKIIIYPTILTEFENTLHINCATLNNYLKIEIYNL